MRLRLRPMIAYTLLDNYQVESAYDKLLAPIGSDARIQER